jgi:uncharacterized protein (TIGR04222 family)
VTFGLAALFSGGWWFVVAFAGLVSATWALVGRERRLAAQRAGVPDPRELDQYELAMLDVDEAIDAVLLAVVNLLRRGVLEPGSRWAANRGYGEPVFSLSVRRDVGIDAHPLERAVREKVPGLAPKSAERLLRLLAECDAVTSMRSTLVRDGFLYRKQRGLLSKGAQFTMCMLPWMAFLAYFAGPSDEARSSDDVIGLLLALGAPLIAMAGPTAWGATRAGVAARAGAEQRNAAAGHTDRDPDDCAQALVRAYERRFIGL